MNNAVEMEYAEPVQEEMEEEVEELEDIEEVEEVEASPQYMHPSYGIKRPPPLTHQPMTMEI